MKVYPRHCRWMEALAFFALFGLIFWAFLHWSHL
jgi:hypothetical protein